MIWAIGDLHLDSKKDKPMDIFGENWIDHDKKIFEHWEKNVIDSDIVLLPGDISWALKLEEAYEDLQAINKMPGHKFISKGNHDYWWSGLKKMNDLNLNSINFINNKAYKCKNIGICGTRGWSPRDSSEFNQDDEKIYNREVLRLKNSINELNKFVGIDHRIALIHYPPFNQDFSLNEFSEIMENEGIDICLYGHLHGDGHQYIREGKIGKVKYYCVASDYLDFKLKEIEV